MQGRAENLPATARTKYGRRDSSGTPLPASGIKSILTHPIDSLSLSLSLFISHFPPRSLQPPGFSLAQLETTNHSIWYVTARPRITHIESSPFRENLGVKISTAVCYGYVTIIPAQSTWRPQKLEKDRQFEIRSSLTLIIVYVF